ncbi:MAG TPA: hypothetical protein VL400_25175, partial [Polyangiaceae bacterium]|nr:hypothetical protein [Polyangiaceae bacterium]
MAGTEDEDIDSGWDDDEEEAAPATRAVDSQKLLAQAGLLAKPSLRQPELEPAPVTPRADSLPPVELLSETGDDPASESPATRRAGEGEVDRFVDRTKTPPAGTAPLRLGGRRHTPVVSDAAVRAKKLDAVQATRQSSAPPPSPANAALRFPPDGSRGLREMHRRPTKISPAVREPDPLAQTVESPIPGAALRPTDGRKASAPVVDLEIPDAFDLSLDDKPASPKGAALGLSFDDLDLADDAPRRPLPSTALTARAIPAVRSRTPRPATKPYPPERDSEPPVDESRKTTAPSLDVKPAVAAAFDAKATRPVALPAAATAVPRVGGRAAPVPKLTRPEVPSS